MQAARSNSSTQLILDDNYDNLSVVRLRRFVVISGLCFKIILTTLGRVDKSLEKDYK